MSKELTLTDSERFTQKIITVLQGTIGDVQITDYHKRLIQNYFITIDAILKKNETKRNAQYEKLEYTWKNVNLEEFAKTAKFAATLGLDSLAKNNLSFIVIKDKAINKYNIGFWEGYVGRELIATRYALDMPVVTSELIYNNDTFEVIKKDRDNVVESYLYKQGNPFDIDKTIVGGFYYFSFSNPEKNKVTVMTLKDILKRKPKKASAEFWGGEKEIWEDGKKTNKKEVVEGWYDEMCLKTILNKAYSSITLDPQKIDDTYQFLKQQETNLIDLEAEVEIEENANVIEIVVTPPKSKPKKELEMELLKVAAETTEPS